MHDEKFNKGDFKSFPSLEKVERRYKVGADAADGLC